MRTHLNATTLPDVMSVITELTYAATTAYVLDRLSSEVFI
ncbi:hypothetical protein HMPREF9622_02219 [Cutibacterium modestum HL037PA3]|uniref:Uncharacterized protein n=1 Tax=Cutibacterium modestum HL044PA1 TaxID=765109 RepID=A0ABP2K8B2_9ACTN|nr:hypothetical protein HMPREF9621_01947 [Cutibacterium modestum HL037PA2]EFS91059.1 hypothetical protein HMPREF9607_02898 [Cutibacterium modestum HL044PA1]EFT14760.1 hypothetical protein HMPREF9622_02219 [Cutibacterium modestum HL037PA3]